MTTATRPKAFTREVMRTVDGPNRPGTTIRTRVRVGSGVFYYQAKCPAMLKCGEEDVAKPCKRYAKNIGQNEHGIVMKCACGELFIADAPDTVAKNGGE